MISSKFPTTYLQSMNTVLTQEVRRYNSLLSAINSSIMLITQALEGHISMSPELERAISAVYNGQVPGLWSQNSYPSKKMLGPWVNDLLARIDFFKLWSECGQPVCFWFSGFFFPQAFLTGTLQNHARRNKLAMDHLHFDFEMITSSSQTIHPPDTGCYIYGLFVEGCRWDQRTRALDEALPKQLFCELPTIWMKPSGRPQKDKKSVFHAPTYKTTDRRGILTTTGHSSNFIMYICLPSRHSESHWLKRGVALICALDD
mmetsp:Transcript_36905/g.84597  ORF Transcript_36905/g.84597 Transcript_36905/m.84597 type:complete len:259 (-) Transcript_36905:105-881(-)